MKVTSGSWHCKQKPDELLEWVYTTVTSARGVTGSSRPTPDSIEVRSQRIPPWGILLAVLLFPIGLLFLLAKEQGAMIIRVAADEAGGCTLSLQGAGAEGVLQAMKQVYEQTTTS